MPRLSPGPSLTSGGTNNGFRAACRKGCPAVGVTALLLPALWPCGFSCWGTSLLYRLCTCVGPWTETSFSVSPLYVCGALD